jgi:putative hydrolase of the HAD superfamily
MKEALGQKDPIKVATDNDYQRVQVDIRNRLNKPLSTVAGVSEWIEQAEELKLKIGIASSSPMEWLNKYLESLRLKDRFETVVGTSDKIRPKPFSDVYLIACERLHVSPDEALAVEDSKNGLVAAKNAKLITVVVPSVLTSGDDFSLADIEISSFQELKLTEIIEILEQRNC